MLPVLRAEARLRVTAINHASPGEHPVGEDSDTLYLANWPPLWLSHRLWVQMVRVT